MPKPISWWTTFPSKSMVAGHVGSSLLQTKHSKSSSRVLSLEAIFF